MSAVCLVKLNCCFIRNLITYNNSLNMIEGYSEPLIQWEERQYIGEKKNEK
jgi:hypothetical protein